MVVFVKSVMSKRCGCMTWTAWFRCILPSLSIIAELHMCLLPSLG